MIIPNSDRCEIVNGIVQQFVTIRCLQTSITIWKMPNPLAETEIISDHLEAFLQTEIGQYIDQNKAADFKIAKYFDIAADQLKISVTVEIGSEHATYIALKWS